MNQELTNNPFNPLTPQKVFDEIKVSLASPCSTKGRVLSDGGSTPPCSTNYIS